MSPEQQTALRTAVHGDPACAVALAARDCVELARLLSVGRTRPKSHEIGNGTVLEVLGLTAGTAFLDTINGDARFRYVKPLLDRGGLRIDASIVQATMQSFVPDILTQGQADALCALGKEPDPLSAQDVAEAVFNIDGSQK
jgi:hypothetical protein